jgi:hypothetical protein
MTTNVEVHRTARVINIDLDLAVAFYEISFPRAKTPTSGTLEQRKHEST